MFLNLKNKDNYTIETTQIFPHLKPLRILTFKNEQIPTHLNTSHLYPYLKPHKYFHT